MTEIRVDAEGLVACDPADFEAAVAVVRERALPGLLLSPSAEWVDFPAERGYSHRAEQIRAALQALTPARERVT